MNSIIQYKIVYEKRRSIAIKVESGRVIVKAPKSTDPEYIEKLVSKHKRWILNRLNTTQESPAERALTSDEIKHLRAAAKEYFERLIDVYSGITGLKCGRIKITSGKLRLGSCSADGNICFSYRLMLYPEKAREYVVLHELAHLVEMNHSKAFYHIIERYMPDYKERKKLLRKS